MDKAYGLWNFPPEMALQLSQKLITTKEQKEMNEAVKKIDFQKKEKDFEERLAPYKTGAPAWPGVSRVD